MKNKCAVCQRSRGKRSCTLNEDRSICSRCCAEIRSQECRGCRHFDEARQYHARKEAARGFLCEIDEALHEEVDQALQLVESKKLGQAERRLETLLENHPDNFFVHYALGTLRSFQGRLSEAVDYFHRSIEIFPYLPEAHHNLGVAYKQMRDVAGTVRAMSKVIELADPEDEIHRQARKLVDGLAQSIREEHGVGLERYLRGHDTFQQAVTCMSAGRLAEAVAGFRRTLDLVDSHAQSWGNLGICYAKQGRRDQALAALDRALEVDPDYELARQNRALIERLVEGEALDETPVVMDYYRDRLLSAGDEQGRT